MQCTAEVISVDIGYNRIIYPLDYRLLFVAYAFYPLRHTTIPYAGSTGCYLHNLAASALP